jgi:hypothetical protein
VKAKARFDDVNEAIYYQMSATYYHLNKKPLGSRIFCFTSWAAKEKQRTVSGYQSNSKQQADSKIAIY